MQLGFHIVIAITLVVACLAQGADPKWVKLRSENFELFSSAGERAGRRTIEQFERTRGFFQQAMQLEASNDVPVRIVLFRSKKEYLPYRPGEAAAAYYLPAHDADLIVLVAGDRSSQVAIHEYVHLLVRHSSLRIPRWLNEGLAELYSTMRRVGGKVVVGDAPPGNIATLLRERWDPLKQVLAASREHYTEKERAGIFYAESWALTHMLLLSQEYRAGATRVVQLLTAGTPSVAALEAVYGIRIEKLQRDLQSYVRQGRPMGLVFDIKLEKSAERPSAELVEGLEVGLLLADLLVDINKTEEARVMYGKVSSENPEAPGPYEGLGYLDYRLGDKDQARIHFRRAFDLGSNSPKMLQHFAGLQREAGDEQIVMTLSRAVRVSPEDVETRLALGHLLMQKGSYMQAVAILQQIRGVNAEQARPVLRMLAYAHLMLNEREMGLEEARLLLDLARTPEEINDAERLLSHLERYAADVKEGHPVSQDRSHDQLGERDVRLVPNEPLEHSRGPGTVRPNEETSMVAGSFVRLQCLGGQARMDLAVGGETFSLLIDNGELVDLKGSDAARMDLHCGTQEPQHVVVRFLPSENTELGTQGVVRKIEFTGPAN